LKPRPWLRYRAAFVLAVLAAASVLALTLAIPAPASGQSPGGWKGSLPKRDTPRGEQAGRGPAINGTAESGPPTSQAPERSGFYSNLGLLDTISREAVNVIADSLALPPGSAVTLYASTPHDANWFVGTVFGEILAERGYKVRILDWGPSQARGDSTNESPPPSPAPVQPKRPRQGGEQNPQGQGAPQTGSDAVRDSTKDDNRDGDEDGTTPADTTASNPDSARADADSVRVGPEGEPPDETSPSEKGQGGEPSAFSQEQPTGSAATPAPGQAPAAALRALPAGEVLDLRVVEFGVSYADVGRKLFFGPLRFTRVGGVYIQVSSLGEPKGELRQVLSAERHRVDRLSSSQLTMAEGASYPFRIPELKVPGLGRYIEPTVVVGIVSSLVYLFYANQSNK
jgi:hypothetical protein